MRKAFWAKKAKTVRVGRPKPGALQQAASQQFRPASEQQPVEIRHAVKIMVGIVSLIVAYFFFFVFGGTLRSATFESAKLSKIGSCKQPDRGDRNYGVTISKLKGRF